MAGQSDYRLLPRALRHQNALTELRDVLIPPRTTITLQQGFCIGEGVVFAPLTQQRLGAELIVEPQMRLFARKKRKQFVITPGL